MDKKVKGFPYSLSSVRPGADPGVQAVIARRWLSHPRGGTGCHYFPPGLRLPSQPQSIAARPVPSYIAWLQADRCEQLGYLPKVVTQLLPRV